MPLPVNDPNHINIRITPVENLTLDPADIEVGKKKIEEETFYFPMQIHLSVGYNFQIFQ